MPNEDPLPQASSRPRDRDPRPADVDLPALDRPLFQLLDDEPGLVAGETAGAYTIVKELGRGGTGAVYLASRADGEFERQVAIKVLKRGMDTEEILRRFRRERQILARLEHPHISRLLDSGTTADHRPYLVMEHVDGEPIDRFCDVEGLQLKERLRLFLKVAEAVQFAHQQLVVHRDLKPSNILVTAEGVPKLLDFGIAKILDPELDLTMTAEGLRPMTPQYASPEQVKGDAITTASDVYSLAVVLYRLLTGRLPHRLPATEDELRRFVCEEVPPRPSAAVRGDRPEAEGRSLIAGEDPKRLARLLTGDLDNILLKALRKEPDRRYSSVDHLANDLRRHLDRRPVSARPDTYGYRLGKLLRRRAREAVAATLAAAVLASFAIDRTLQHRRVAAERDKAREVSGFLTELFEISDPTEALSSRVSAREILDRGARRLERGELLQQPELRAALTHTIGTVYRSLGAYDVAEKLLTKALAERRQLFGPDHADVAESLHELAVLRGLRGDHAGAEALFTESQSLRRRLFPEHHPTVLATKVGLARALWAQGRYREAESRLRAALELADRRLTTTEVAEALSLRATALRDLGRYDEAEASFLEALRLRRDLHGSTHPDVADTLADLAALLVLDSRLEEAEARQREAVAITEATFGERHPEAARSHQGLAAVLHAQGHYQAAEELLRRALASIREAYGDEHPRVPAILNDLGLALVERAQYQEAEAVLRRALELAVQVWGSEHPYIAGIKNDLALAFRGQRRLADAEALQREALDLITRSVGDEHPHTATAMANLGELLRLRGDLDTAEPLARRSLELRRRALGDVHFDVARGLRELAGLLRDKGKLVEAETLYREALAVGRNAWGSADHLQQLATLNNLATLLDKQQRFQDAEVLYRRVLSIYRRELGEEHPYVATALNNLGSCLWAQGKLNAAEPLVRRALEMRREQLGDDHSRVAISLTSLAEIHLARHDPAAAETLLRRAVQVFRATYGEQHSRTAGAKSLLGESLALLGRRDEARPLLEESYAALHELLGESSSQTRKAQCRLDHLLSHPLSTPYGPPC